MIGTRIYGYCNGFFGREDYDDKIIILEGRNWIVCAYIDEDKGVACVNFDSQEHKEMFVKLWSAKEDRLNG